MRPRPLRLVMLLALAACGSSPGGGEHGADAAVGPDSALDGGALDGGALDGGALDGGGLDGGGLDGGGLDGGSAPDAPPTPVDPPPPFAVVAGEAHACALSPAGALRCWGANHMGQLGVATTETCSGYACAKLPAAVMEGVAAVHVGGSSTCAIHDDHTVSCFGDDRYRQFGFAGPDTCSGSACVKAPHVVPGLTANAMALGQSFACALGTTGAVACAGDNSIGQIGDGTATMAPAFTPVSGLGRPAIALVAGSHHACALLDDHTVACWGSNQQGQLGTPTSGGCAGASCSTTPLAIAGLTDVVALTAGAQHTCARRADRSIWCWGSNQTGQLAGGADTCLGASCSKTPHQVELGPVFEVTAGWSHTCARLVDGSVACWGDNFAGQIGATSTSTCGRPFDSCVPAPATIAGATDAALLALGGGTTCVLQHDGGALCWGSNSIGQYGDGSTSTATAPAPVVW